MNDATKKFKVRKLHYTELMCKMFEIYFYLYPNIKKGKDLNNTKCTDNKFSDKVICKDIKYGLLTEIKDYIKDKDTYY